METDDLIRSLQADGARPPMPMRRLWWLAAGAAAFVAAAVFFATIGPRPDIAAAAGTVRFLFKFAFTGVLALSAFAAVRMLSVPETSGYGRLAVLALAPLLMAGAVLLELGAVPEADWGRRLVGSNMAVCLTFIPLIGVGPLAIFLAALRHGAPTRPVLAGAVAGVLAGGVAATFYAAHCTDDSPLFVATWYSLAIAGLALAGALGARTVVRW